MKILDTLGKVSLVCFVALLSMKDLNAMDGNVEAKLKSIRRSLISAEAPTPLLVEGKKAMEYGGTPEIEARVKATVSKEDMLESAKKYVELLCIVTAADGELSALEEADITKRLQSLDLENYLGSEGLAALMDFNSMTVEKARSGAYKGVNLEPLLDSYVQIQKQIGGPLVEEKDAKGGIASETVRTLLLDAIMAAQADGYAKEEKKSVKQIAAHFGLPKEIFGYINVCCNFETLLKKYQSLATDKTFKEDVDHLFASVHKYMSEF